MKKLAIVLASSLLAILPAQAEQTPLHTIAVAGEAEIELTPDFAVVQIGVITQGAVVADALSENNAKMAKVIDAIRALGIADKDIHTSEFAIQPKYEPGQAGQYDYESFRPIVGYFISNNVSVSVTDLSKIAQIIDASVQAGANASGTVQFKVKDITQHMDDARRAAVENAHHKALVLTGAAGMTLGPALSITDNGANPNYNDRGQGDMVETVVVTGSRIPTQILAGQISVTSQVTVLYATH